MTAGTGFSDDKYDVFRPKMFGSQSPLIDLEPEMGNRGQAELCL